MNEGRGRKEGRKEGKKQGEYVKNESRTGERGEGMTRGEVRGCEGK